MQARSKGVLLLVVSKVSNYRWYVLALAALTHTLVIGMPTMALSVLFKEISENLGLNLVQIGTVWGMSTGGISLLSYLLDCWATGLESNES